jgi:hypothetical protein
MKGRVVCPFEATTQSIGETEENHYALSKVTRYPVEI